MKLKNSKMDLLMEGICLVMLVGLTLYLILNWGSIPNRIPMHYDWAGNVDRWGTKGELLIVPGMAWFLYLMISAFEKLPDIWNTGVQVTEGNKEQVYRVLRYMIKSLKLIMVADFTYMTVISLLGRNLSGWFTPIVLIAVFGDLIFWMVKLFKVR